jgi:hypothetical protein
VVGSLSNPIFFELKEVVIVNWIAVNSTRAEAVAYDAFEFVIYVRFHDGAVYRYEDCDSDVWEELIDPGVSVGRFISDELDGRGYSRIR